MGIPFGEVLLRLKQVLGLHSDKEVAEALGMADRAFAARKARGAFPEDKLYALATRRPELKIDPAYVLRGRRTPSTTAVPTESAVDGDRMALCMKLLFEAASRRGVALSGKSAGALADGMYSYAAKGFAPDEALADLVIDTFVNAAGSRP